MSQQPVLIEKGDSSEDEEWNQEDVSINKNPLVAKTIPITTPVFQFKVTLKGIRPPIWRRIQVPSNYTFQSFHLVLNKAMGWTNRHLHQFTVRKNKFIIGFHDPDKVPYDEVFDERRMKLSEVFLTRRQKILYQYDFGDNWMHDVMLETILAPISFHKYPVCLRGRRACPPEDCGGANGYMELLEVLRNPSHSDYEATKRWLTTIGLDNFSPEVFTTDIFGN